MTELLFAAIGLIVLLVVAGAFVGWAIGELIIRALGWHRCPSCRETHQSRPMIERLRCLLGHREVVLRWRAEGLERYDCRACGAFSPVVLEFIEKPTAWDIGLEIAHDRDEAARRARVAAMHE